MSRSAMSVPAKWHATRHERNAARHGRTLRADIGERTDTPIAASRAQGANSRGVNDAFEAGLADLDEQGFQERYGMWQPMSVSEVGRLFATTGVRWWIAGGRAARLGAAARAHEDVDVVVSVETVANARTALSRWHVWENNPGALRPLFPGDALSDECQQLWVRRTAHDPWVLDMLIDHSAEKWTYRFDPQVQVEWDRAVLVSDGVPYLRPALALLHKAHLDRQKDRDDLTCAILDTEDRQWLVRTLQRLGYHSWAQLASRPEPSDARVHPARQSRQAPRRYPRH